MRTTNYILATVACLGLLGGEAGATARGRHQLTGPATRFAYAGDKWVGGSMRCLGRQLRVGEQGIAHRTLPCGTLVRVTNRRTGLKVIAPVVDRGPYGGCLDEGWTRGPCVAWAIKRRASDPGTWRGVADLGPATVEALQHKSFDRVTLEVLP